MGECDAAAIKKLQKGGSGRDAEVRKFSSTVADARDTVLDGKLLKDKESRAGNGGEGGGGSGSFARNLVSNGVEDARDVHESFDPRGLGKPHFKWGKDDGHVGCFDNAEPVRVHGDDFAVPPDDDVRRAVLSEYVWPVVEGGKNCVPGAVRFGDLSRTNVRERNAKSGDDGVGAIREVKNEGDAGTGKGRNVPGERT